MAFWGRGRNSRGQLWMAFFGFAVGKEAFLRCFGLVWYVLFRLDPMNG